MPLGAVAPDEAVSVTLTVQFEAWLTTTGVIQATDVTVEWRPGVMMVIAWLPPWDESPAKLAVIW